MEIPYLSYTRVNKRETCLTGTFLGKHLSLHPCPQAGMQCDTLLYEMMPLSNSSSRNTASLF